MIRLFPPIVGKVTLWLSESGGVRLAVPGRVSFRGEFDTWNPMVIRQLRRHRALPG